MRKAIVSFGVFALLSLGAFGCKHDGDSSTMKMDSALPCCGDECKKMDNCCKMDKGTASCSMGGKCCVKK